MCRHCDHDLFKFTLEKLLLKAKMKLVHSLLGALYDVESVSCDEPDAGLLQTLGFHTGFANAWPL